MLNVSTLLNQQMLYNNVRSFSRGFMYSFIHRVAGFFSSWEDSTSDEVCRCPVIVFSRNFLDCCRHYSTSSQACPIWRRFSTCNDQCTRLFFDAMSSGFRVKKLYHLFYEELLLDFKASHLSPFFCNLRLKFGNCEEPTWAGHDVT